MTGDLPVQRPEGKVLQAALKADGRSMRQVAPLAGMSEARWRQIVKGSMTANGSTVEVVAPAATLARMAFVLNIEAKQLGKARRDDAAELLENMYQAVRRGVDPVPQTVGQLAEAVDEIDLIYASRTMSPKQKLDAIGKVLRLRAQLEASMEVSPDVAAAAEIARAEPQDAG